MSPIPKGRVIVTCGPSFEPIDEVRRITNHSTGKLGYLLSNRLALAGWNVLCLKGLGATHHGPLEAGVERLPFGTNDQLFDRLTAVQARDEITAVFHAAALCDFKLKRLAGANAQPIEGSKISSRTGELTLTLEPAKKLIGELHALFPKAKIVGWKYELDGSRDEALAKGARQIAENHTTACIVNGRAFGAGFGILQGGDPLREAPDKESLCNWIAEWLSEFNPA